MKTILGILLIVVGMVVGIYVGLWLCFVGGIIDVIQQFRAPELNVTTLAFGIVKVMFAGLFGWASALFLIVPGAALFASGTK